MLDRSGWKVTLKCENCERTTTVRLENLGGTVSVARFKKRKCPLGDHELGQVRILRVESVKTPSTLNLSDPIKAKNVGKVRDVVGAKGVAELVRQIESQREEIGVRTEEVGKGTDRYGTRKKL